MNKTAKKIMPASRIGRMIVGVLLIIGGILGFLPVLGFWMIPLGFIILSVDFPFIRRWRRRADVRLTRWWRERKARKLRQKEEKESHL